VVKSFGADQVLTKILQIEQKFTFDIVHILNQGRISKIKKISDGTDLPKKKSNFISETRLFFTGISEVFRAQGFKFGLRRSKRLQNQFFFICKLSPNAPRNTSSNFALFESTRDLSLKSLYIFEINFQTQIQFLLAI